MARDEVSKITSVSVVAISSLLAIAIPTAIPMFKDTVTTLSSNVYGCLSMAWGFEALNESQGFPLSGVENFLSLTTDRVTHQNGD